MAWTLEEHDQHVQALIEQRGVLVEAMGGVADAVQARDDGRATDDERRQLDEHIDAIRKIDEELDQSRESRDRAEAARRAREEQDRLQTTHGGRRPGRLTVNEPDIYSRGTEFSFFTDAAHMLRSPAARDRIERHMMHEMSRRGPEARAASGTGDFTSLVTPQYLLDEFAAIPREGRPTINALPGSELPPDGMTVTIPRGNTGTQVGSQTTQNTAVTSRTYTTNDLQVPVITVAGFNDLSRQSVDRGRGTDLIVMEDLAGATAEEEDRQVINGTGTNNEHYGILATTNITTITVSDAGAATQMRQVISAFGTMRTNRKRAPQAVIMHPRRWSYWRQAVDSNGRPLITSERNGPFNTFGNVQPTQTLESEISGFVDNIPVILDANFPTTLSYDVTQSSTTDPIFIVRASDHRYWEESAVPNMVEVQPDAKNLTVTLVAWKYAAYSAARYVTSTLVLAGSGLTTPPEVG